MADVTAKLVEALRRTHEQLQNWDGESWSWIIANDAAIEALAAYEQAQAEPVALNAVKFYSNRAATPAPAPHGWKLVPVEPTLKMIEAGRMATDDKLYPQDFLNGPRMQMRDQWDAMLAAAPEAGQGKEDSHGTGN